MERTILHINVVNFFTAVARALEPKLCTFPVAVAAAGGTRRIVLDSSLEAREAGVHRGMTLAAAKRVCLDLRIVHPAPAAYDRASAYLFDRASRLSPLTEMAGPGHVFIDLTGTRRLLGPEVDTAEMIRKTIRQECRFECAVGLASNRLVSKVATRVIKPRGLCRVIPGCEEEFMAPLPVRLLPGVEESILAQLVQFNLQIIRDIQRIPPGEMAKALGPLACDIDRLSRGIDDTPVREITQPSPVIAQSLQLSEPTNDEPLIRIALFKLVATAAAKLRSMGLAAGAITLCIEYADGIRNSKARRLPTPLRGDLSIQDVCTRLLGEIITRRVRLTHMELQLSRLTFPYGQLDLFLDTDREERLMAAIDSIRATFGGKAIQFWGREVA